MKTPTDAEVRRGQINVEAFVLEAEAMLEHSSPRLVVGQMMLAAGIVATDNDLDGPDYVRLFASVLSSLMRRDVTVSVEPGDAHGEDDD
jgi:hypothetical protein